MLGVNSSAKSGQKSQYWKSLLLKKGAGYDNVRGMERNGSGSGGLVWCGVVWWARMCATVKHGTTHGGKSATVNHRTNFPREVTDTLPLGTGTSS